MIDRVNKEVPSKYIVKAGAFWARQANTDALGGNDWRSYRFTQLLAESWWIRGVPAMRMFLALYGRVHCQIV